MVVKFQLGRNQEQKAMDKYNANYDNDLYRKAIEGKTTKFANSLIDEALALCGSPFFKMSNRKWSKDAENFLVKFA